MKVTRAQESDLEALSILGEQFAQEGQFPFERPAWLKSWTAILKSGLGEILIGTQDGQVLGCIAILYAPSLNTGRLQAQEAGWFVRKDARGCGLRLLAAAENAARWRGAAALLMAHLAGLNERLGELYRRRGYRELETLYLLEL